MSSEFYEFGDVVAKIEPPFQAGRPSIELIAPFQGLVKFFGDDGKIISLSWQAALELSARVLEIQKTCEIK